MYCSEIVPPVVDLRAEPTPDPLIVRGHDRRRLTQILPGQCVHVLDSKNGWCEVEIPEQMVGHAQKNPHPYRGYVQEDFLRRKNSCSCRSSLPLQWSEEIETRLLCKLRLYLSAPYVWGGLSAHISSYQGVQTGPDCSGLVWLAYQDLGMFLPRNAVDQCAVGHVILPHALQSGDLVFNAPCNGKVNHVMVWSGSTLIEATDLDGARVREISPEERFGLSFSDLTLDGIIVNDIQFFFRRYFVSNSHSA
jgi:hypothetical protein